MNEIVCIRFKPCGKLYDFDAAEMALKPGDMVVVESDLGLSIGKVVRKSPSAENKEYKKILRLASQEDVIESKANAALEKEAFDFCRERVMARGLQMKLIRTEATLDRKRIIFYFISEKRIDFRELVKDLAQKFRTRIEMRQVGVRDEAKMTGGLGLCGRQLCCASFLSNFAPISIKMAKKQELVLNTGKLSGICGRLMCCLSYEYGNKKPCEKEVREETAVIEEVIEVTSSSLDNVSGPVSGARTEQKSSVGQGKKDFPPSSTGRNRRFERREKRSPQEQKNQKGPEQTASTKNPNREARGPRPQQKQQQEQAPKPQGELQGQTQNAQNELQDQTQITGIESSQNAQNLKKKKKRRWRKRGPKGNALQNPGSPSSSAPGPDTGN